MPEPSNPPLPIRIVVVAPPADIAYCIQRTSRADTVGHCRSAGGDLAFDLDIRLKDGGVAPDFLGPFVQGRPGDRHIAILIGTLAGDAASSWTRAIKMKLGGIAWSHVRELQARPGTALTARVEGRTREGAPSCATLPLLDGGWSVAPAG